jgi:hypothetical protein
MEEGQDNMIWTCKGCKEKNIRAIELKEDMCDHCGGITEVKSLDLNFSNYWQLFALVALVLGFLVGIVLTL